MFQNVTERTEYKHVTSLAARQERFMTTNINVVYSSHKEAEMYVKNVHRFEYAVDHLERGILQSLNIKFEQKYPKVLGECICFVTYAYLTSFELPGF